MTHTHKINETSPTVKIKTENGPVRINLTDYDEKKHTLVTDEADALKPLEPAQKAAIDKAVESEKENDDEETNTVTDKATLTVGDDGKRGKAKNYFVQDAQGKPVDKKSFKSKEEAKAHLATLEPVEE